MEKNLVLRNAPQLVSLPDVPEPTTYGVIGEYRVSAKRIALSILEMLSINPPEDLAANMTPPKEDVPDSAFTGPF